MMSAGAPDYFSFQAGLYARSRPRYPDALMRWLRSRAPSGAACWDVGTGSGQVAVLAAQHFDRVFASDVSAAQLSHAPPVQGVTYAVEPAERSSLGDNSVDAVFVGAAAHWLDLPAFYSEVRRVARPGALVSLFSYGTHLGGESELQAVIDHYIQGILGPWWSTRLAMIADAYAQLPFPFDEEPFPAFAASTHGDLEALEDLLRTWSAAQEMARETGQDPIAGIRDDLRAAWMVTAAPDVSRTLRWPTFARIGRGQPVG